MRVFGSLLFLSVSFVLLGVGTAQEKKVPPDEKSPFAGDYAGAFTTRSLNPSFPDKQKGSCKLTVASDGKVKGEIHNASADFKTALEGKVSKKGDVEFTTLIAKQTFTFKGVVTKTKEGHFKGTLKQYLGDEAVVSIEFDLGPK